MSSAAIFVCHKFTIKILYLLSVLIYKLLSLGTWAFMVLSLNNTDSNITYLQSYMNIDLNQSGHISSMIQKCALSIFKITKFIYWVYRCFILWSNCMSAGLPWSRKSIWKTKFFFRSGKSQGILWMDREI